MFNKRVVCLIVLILAIQLINITEQNKIDSNYKIMESKQQQQRMVCYIF
jgi:hypothetical protein